MAKKNILTVLSMIVLMSFISGCSDSGGKRQETVFKQIPEIADIKPQNPVKVKLKRDVGGKYSWELTGDDVDKILQSDKKLKDTLVDCQINK